MPWTTPLKGTAGTVITEAWSIANVVNLLNWLRGMTGNADPPATNYVVVADSPSSTSWRKVPADALAAGAVTTHLGYTPVNKAGDSMSGNLQFANHLQGVRLAGSGWLRDDIGGVQTQLFAHGARLVVYTAGAVPMLDVNALGITLPGGTQVRDDIPGGQFQIFANGNRFLVYKEDASGLIFEASDNGTLTFKGATVWTSANDGPTSGLFAEDSAKVGGRTPTAAVLTPGAIPITDANGKLDGWITTGGTPATHSHSGDALIPATVAASTSLSAGTITASGQLVSAVGTGTAPLAVSSTTEVPNLNAALLNGQTAAAIIAAAAGGGIVAGVIALWDTATAPTGWTFYTAMNGRFPLGAGGGFTLGATNAVSTHNHTSDIAHGHTDTISVGGTVGADGSSPVKVTVVTPGDANAALSGHGHSFTGSKGGSVTSLGTTNATASTVSHMPPYLVLNYIKKS